MPPLSMPITPTRAEVGWGAASVSASFELDPATEVAPSPTLPHRGRE